MKWPDAVPFDPSLGTVSPALEALFEGPGSAGPVLLLAVGRNAQKRGWAADAAIALADAFAGRGDSVLLADLSLNNPELHTLLGSSNEEGLSDVFLFGASLDHATLTVPGKWFRLVPASPYTPDARELLEHPRWHSLFEEVAQDQNKLLIYLPVELDGADLFADRVGHTIVLADPSDLDYVRDRLAHDADVIGVLTAPRPVPPESVQARAAPAAPSIERRDEQDFERIRLPKDSAREALIADLRARQRAALMAPPPAMQPLPFEEAAIGPAEEKPGRAPAAPAGPPEAAPRFTLHGLQPTPRRARAWLLPAVLVLVLVAAGVGAWYFWQARSANPRNNSQLSETAQPQDRQAATPPAAADSPTAAGRVPYSVAIASYHDLEVALGRLDQLVEQAPDLPFYIGPIDVQGRVFYRIMAGPLRDSASAMLLRDTLVVRRIKTISSGWDVLDTPFAFLLGNHARREDADAQRDVAISKGVPAYVLEGTNPEGATVYNVYTGAYAGPGDAQFMRAILKNAGFPDNLVERTGSIRS